MKNPLVVSFDDLDKISARDALGMISTVRGFCGIMQVTNFYYHHGKSIVAKIHDDGTTKVLIDLKLHDSPKQAAKRAMQVVAVGADIITVHASAGVAMMRAVKEAVWPTALVFANLLPSWLSSDNIARIYGLRPIAQITLDLARLAREAEVAGIICLASEVSMLAHELDFRSLELVVPVHTKAGGNPLGTPAQAAQDGASLFIVGHDTQEADPVEALIAIAASVRNPHPRPVFLR